MSWCFGLHRQIDSSLLLACSQPFSGFQNLTFVLVAKFYEVQDTFHCIGQPGLKLSYAQVNDNTCDCPDGSDEPGTAACANLDANSPSQPLPGSFSGTTNTTHGLPGFWCANEGHIGAYIPFIYVNDGVCDYELCCDGTEEYSGVGGVKCPNKCAEIGKEHRRIEDERKKALEKASKKRKTMAKESKELRRRVEAKIASIKAEINELTAKRDDLQRKHNEALAADAGKVVKGAGSGGKLGVLVGLAKERINELRETLQEVQDERKELRGKVNELEEILRKFREEYNPNFNDEGVKSAVKAWEDYAAKTAAEAKTEIPDAEIRDVLSEDSEETGINWQEFEEGEVSDTDIRKFSSGATNIAVY